MGNLWLKIKVWTKGIVALLVVLYALFFAYNNSEYHKKMAIFASVS